MALGAELGVDVPSVAVRLHLLAEIFLRLIRVIVAPLIFSALATGIAAHGNLKRLGRVALKTFIYFEIVTTLALIVGAVAIDITRAGEGLKVPLTESLAVKSDVQMPDLEHFLLNIFPENIVQSVAQNQILQLAVFALLFGTALAMLPEQKRAPMLSVLRSLTDTMFQITKIIMYMAPLAAGAALSYTVGSLGIATLLPLGKLILTFYGAALAFILLVLLPILLIARIPIRKFINAIAEPTAIGFATSTSETAIPLSMERMERFGVPQWIVSFVIPSGYSFNMDGASLYLSIAAIFTAQAAGIHLSFTQQAFMLLTLMLTSKGVAGVPRAVLVVLMATAASLHIPTAPIVMILGVDALIDMGRTALNVIGNCLATAVIGRSHSSLRGTASGKPAYEK
jgi:proton glutamate symport protein